MRVAVVVLAGGRARRWGGRDKTAVLLGARTVLEHAVAWLRDGVRTALPDAAEPVALTVVAGPDEHPAAASLGAVRWVREDPPGAGPAGGLAAAIGALDSDVDVVVLGAGDAPFGGSAVPRLLSALEAAGSAVDAAVGVDPQGRTQPLLAVYRASPLRAALARLGEPAGASLRALVAGLVRVDVPVTQREALDLDTPDALAVAARELPAASAEVPSSDRDS